MTEQTEQQPVEQPQPAGHGQTQLTEQPTLAEQPQPLTVPPMPEAPPVQPEPEPSAGKDRRVLRAVLRWTAAVAVFAAVGAGTAFGITGMERTDLPGLATRSDGRWDYPTLTRPPLPSGSPRPFAVTNTADAHYADLRSLVLPAPKGASEDKKLRGTDGWLATKDFLAEYQPGERGDLRQMLVDHGLRHIAARGFTTPDGTRTRIYLLQFGTGAVVDDMLNDDMSADAPHYQLRGADTSVFDDTFPAAARVENIDSAAYTEMKPYGAEQVRQAYVTAGDTFALIVQSRKGGAKAVPFQQTVALQSQLLG